MNVSKEVQVFLTEMAAKGGKARARKLTKARRLEISRMGVDAKQRKRAK